jgi:hypothetical protein
MFEILWGNISEVQEVGIHRSEAQDSFLTGEDSLFVSQPGINLEGR